MSKLIDVQYAVHGADDGKWLFVRRLTECVGGRTVDVSDLVGTDLRFTCLAHLQRFLATRTGEEVKLCAR